MDIPTDTKQTVEANEWVLHLLNGLLACVFGLVLAETWWQFRVPGKPGWPEAVLLLLALSATVAALARHLPLQNVLAAAFLIALGGSAATWLDIETGIPFGIFTASGDVGPKIAGTLPWLFPLLWATAILNSRGVGRLMLRPWRKTHTYGFRLIGITAVLTMLFEACFEPYATRVRHYWFWEPTKLPLTWQGVPLANFFGWVVVTLLILAFVTPLLINKQPVSKHAADFHPLAVWLGALLLFGIGAARAGQWTAVVLDAIVGALTAFFSAGGARW